MARRPKVKIVAGVPMTNSGYGSHSWELKIEVWEARDDTGDWMWMTGDRSVAEGRVGSMAKAVRAALNFIKERAGYITIGRRAL